MVRAELDIETAIDWAEETIEDMNKEVAKYADMLLSGGSWTPPYELAPPVVHCSVYAAYGPPMFSEVQPDGNGHAHMDLWLGKAYPPEANEWATAHELSHLYLGPSELERRLAACLPDELHNELPWEQAADTVASHIVGHTREEFEYCSIHEVMNA
jgi:hypothetical protein